MISVNEWQCPFLLLNWQEVVCQARRAAPRRAGRWRSDGHREECTGKVSVYQYIKCFFARLLGTIADIQIKFKFKSYHTPNQPITWYWFCFLAFGDTVAACAIVVSKPAGSVPRWHQSGGPNQWFPGKTRSVKMRLACWELELTGLSASCYGGLRRKCWFLIFLQKMRKISTGHKDCDSKASALSKWVFRRWPAAGRILKL